MPGTKWTKAEVDRRFDEVLGDASADPVGTKKRQRILRAAHSLFLKRGYRKTSVDEIARKAEIAKGTVYLYFENKGQLLIRAIALEKSWMRDRIAPLFDGSIPKSARLRHWLLLTITAARDLPLTTRLLGGDTELFAALEDAGSEDLAARRADAADFVMDLIEDFAPGRLTATEKRARAEVLTSVSMLHPTLLDPRFRGDRPLDEFAAIFCDMLLEGIAPRDPR